MIITTFNLSLLVFQEEEVTGIKMSDVLKLFIDFSIKRQWFFGIVAKDTILKGRMS